MIILPPCFLNKTQIQEAPEEDLWCEIADCMFYKSPEVDAYVERLENELKRRVTHE